MAHLFQRDEVADPALDPKNQHHHHEHIHHTEFAERGKVEPAYTTGTTIDRSVIADQVIHDSKGLHYRQNGFVDEENGTDMIADEKGIIQDPIIYDTDVSNTGNQRFSVTAFYRKYRLLVHIFIGMLFTGWWIASLILHRNNKNWIIPFLLWLCIMLRLVFWHVPSSAVMRIIRWVWQRTGVKVSNSIPEKLQIPLGAAFVVAVILAGAFGSPESEDNTRANRAVSLFGLVVFLSILWITSRNRSMVVWRTVIVGMLSQFIISLFVLRTQAGYDIFGFISQLARELLGYAHDGVAFLTSKQVAALPYFFFTVLPAVVFFVSVVSILYHWGTLQWFIVKAATFFFWALKVSGAEAVVASASPFIGQGESAMLIKPFIAHLTLAELHQVMCSGFATISGSVLVGYIGLGVNGEALTSSCVMSIPASLAISKLRWPETEETLTAGRVVIPDDEEHRATNTLHAFANGAWLGVKIAGTILATLLCIIALVGLIDGLLGWWGSYINIDDPKLNLQLILGYICYPIAFLLGVPRNNTELRLVGELIGTKIIENEFVAYTLLQTDPRYTVLSPRGRVIATYALCGFGNIGSLGIQIGVLSQLSPSRSGDVSRIALSALLSGIISTLTSASIAGMLITDQKQFFSPSTSL